MIDAMRFIIMYVYFVVSMMVADMSYQRNEKRVHQVSDNVSTDYVK